jgi:hypothetical protein
MGFLDPAIQAMAMGVAWLLPIYFPLPRLSGLWLLSANTSALANLGRRCVGLKIAFCDRVLTQMDSQGCCIAIDGNDLEKLEFPVRGFKYLT